MDKQIEYKENDRIDVETLTDLYKSVGWTAYSDHPEIMENILPGALHYISAWSGDKLVGLIRTVGDGCYILYIQDILVHPDYHRRGIGTELINRILEQSKNIRQIILTTDNSEKTKAFYKSVGLYTLEERNSVGFTN